MIMPNENGSTDDTLVASRLMCYCCFDTLIDALLNNNANTSNKIHNKFVKDLVPDASVQCPIFVTWEKQYSNTGSSSSSSLSWQLRGCIGTLSPRLVASAVEEYAIISAFRDRRFHQITVSEVRSLRVSVSLLVKYEPCRDVYDWTIGVHGIIIKFVANGHSYDATFLPEVAQQQQWDQVKTVSSLIQKAGYDSTISQDLLARIVCTRYQSSKCIVPYTDYVDDNCKGTDPIDNIVPPKTIKNKKKATSTTTISRPWPFFNKNR